MDLLTMYPAKLGSPQTILAADITADATAMVVSDASVLPGAPNIAVIGSDENCEIISYSAIDSSTNTVTISARGLGDSTAKAWTSGTTVARNHSSLDHNTLMANIASLNTGKAEASHNHDDRYYTESEMDTALAGKQATLQWDTTPTSGSTKSVNSGGIYTAIHGRALHISMPSTSTLGEISNPAITTTMRVVNIVWDTPSNVTSNVSWNTNTAGKLILSGTLSGPTTAEIDLIDFG